MSEDGDSHGAAPVDEPTRPDEGDRDCLRAVDQIDFAEAEGGGKGLRLPPYALGMGLTLLALVAVYVFALVARRPYEPLVFGWRVQPMDWLFLVTVAVGGWVAGHQLVTNVAGVRRVLSQLRRDRLAAAAGLYLAAFALVGAFGPALLGPPDTNPLHGYQPPVGFGVSTVFIGNCIGPVVDGACQGTLAYPLGSTPHGRGMTRVAVLGARAALELAVVVAAIIVPLGTVVGVVAGYYGGRVDWLLTRALDVQATVPAFVVFLVAVFVFGRSLLLVVVVFGLLSWDGVARVVRQETRRLRADTFVLAARSAGASRPEIVRRHVLPNVTDTVLVATARRIPVLILTEAAVSFLELNNIEVPTWGETIRRGMTEIFPVMWWISTIPVVLLTLTTVSFVVLGDELRDVLDPTRH